MPKPSEHRMLKHMPEHDAWNFAEQCPTYAPHVLTRKFGLLEHSSHVSNARRGAEGFGHLGDEKSRSATASRGLRAVNS